MARIGGPPMRRIRLYRHPDCARCAKISRVHHAFDWLGLVDCTTDPAPGGPLKMGEIEVEDLRTGATCKGVDAVRAVARQIPAYWPLLPLLFIPPIARRIDR